VGTERGTRRRTDLLLQLALEHRELTNASRFLRQRGPDLTRGALRDAAIRIVEHELAHRLLVHPLLRRDHRGRQLFRERREEQLLLADRLRHLLATTPESAPPNDRRTRRVGTDPVLRLDQQFAAHADREEIVSFPHLRRLVEPDELAELGAQRLRQREHVTARLTAPGSPVDDGSWADAPRRDLPQLLELPEDVIITIPDLEPSGPLASA
jgi:hypothetical protein